MNGKQGWIGFVAVAAGLAMGCSGAVDDAEGDAGEELAGDASSADVVDATELTAFVADFIDMEAVQSPDPDALKLKIKKDGIKTVHDGTVWLVPFVFRSQSWHSNAWDHYSVLYVPAELDPRRAGMVAIVQQATDDLDPGVNIVDEFGAKTAAALGLPVAVLDDVPHPTYFNEVEAPNLAVAHPGCFGTLLVETGLDQCGEKMARTSESLNWSVGLRIAETYLRAITAIESIATTIGEGELGAVPAFTVEKAVLGGAGRRARVLWMGGLLDDRVAGLWIAAGDMANFPSFYTNMARTWSNGFPWGAPEHLLAFFDTDFGNDWASVYDPYGYMEALTSVSIMLLRGTNDALYPLGSYALYADKLPADHSLVLVPNYGHGMASETHVDAWRSFLHRVTAGISAPVPSAEIIADSGAVTVSIAVPDGAYPPESVRVHYTNAQVTLDDHDLRDALWTNQDLEIAGTRPGASLYQGAFNVSLTNWAAYVEIIQPDTPSIPSVATTPVHLSWQD